MTAAQPDMASSSVGRAVRVLAGVLATALVVVVTATETPARASHYEDRACPQHVTQGVQARERYLRCEEQRIDPPGDFGYVLGVARCESGPDLMASKGARHGGTYQHRNDLWGGRFERFTAGRHPRDGRLRRWIGAFRSQVIVTFRFTRAFGWGLWACA